MPPRGGDGDGGKCQVGEEEQVNRGVKEADGFNKDQ